jgi:hypothetical protein
MYPYLLCLSACETSFVLLWDAEKYRIGENYLMIGFVISALPICYYGDDNKGVWNILDTKCASGLEGSTNFSSLHQTGET